MVPHPKEGTRINWGLAQTGVPDAVPSAAAYASVEEEGADRQSGAGEACVPVEASRRRESDQVLHKTYCKEQERASWLVELMLAPLPTLLQCK